MYIRVVFNPEQQNCEVVQDDFKGFQALGEGNNIDVGRVNGKLA